MRLIILLLIMVSCGKDPSKSSGSKLSSLAGAPVQPYCLRHSECAKPCKDDIEANEAYDLCYLNRHYPGDIDRCRATRENAYQKCTRAICEELVRAAGFIDDSNEYYAGVNVCKNGL